MVGVVFGAGEEIGVEARDLVLLGAERTSIACKQVCPVLPADAWPTVLDVVELMTYVLWMEAGACLLGSVVASTGDVGSVGGERIIVSSSPLICVAAGAGEAAELAGLPVLYDIPLGVSKSISHSLHRGSVLFKR